MRIGLPVFAVDDNHAIRKSLSGRMIVTAGRDVEGRTRRRSRGPNHLSHGNLTENEKL